MLDLAQASGGQIYQDHLGVVRYRQVLNIGSLTGTPDFEFASKLSQATDTFGVYGKATDSGSTEQYAACLWPAIPRAFCGRCKGR